MIYIVTLILCCGSMSCVIVWVVYCSEWVCLWMCVERCIAWDSTYFGQFLCPSSGVLDCKHGDGICHTRLLTACEQDQDRTTDEGHRNCPEHVEFCSKNKFEKWVHLVGFIIRFFFHFTPFDVLLAVTSQYNLSN